jgi:hypothetical protein
MVASGSGSCGGCPHDHGWLLGVYFLQRVVVHLFVLAYVIFVESQNCQIERGLG